MEGRGNYARASEWLIALQEHPDDDDLADRFESWLLADPSHARDWSEISRTYDLIGSLPTASGDRRNSHLARDGAGPGRTVGTVFPVGSGQREPRRGVWRRPASAVIALVVAASIALFVLSGGPFVPGAEYETGTGETRAIRLADGSSVVLAPDSALSVEFSGAERGVRLFEGTALFEVRSDAARPFRVRAGYIDSTVLGTSFEVRTGDDATEVAVREGVVGVQGSLAAPGLSARLEAGDWLRLSADGAVGRRHLPPSTIASWTERRLIVRDRPVSEVVAFIRHYYGGVLLLHGARLADAPVTGVYDLSDPAAAVRALARSHDADVYQLSPWVLAIVGE